MLDCPRCGLAHDGECTLAHRMRALDALYADVLDLQTRLMMEDADGREPSHYPPAALDWTLINLEQMWRLPAKEPA